MERQWFEATIKYERLIDGNEKMVTEKYLVEADDISDVKPIIIDALAPFFTGDNNVTSIKNEKYDEVVLNNANEANEFYSVTYVNYEIDDKGREKAYLSKVLIQESSFKNAYITASQAVDSNVEIESINHTKIVEVFTKNYGA